MPVRPALPEDVPALADLAAATFPLACPPHLSREAIAGFIAESLSVACFSGYLQDPQRVVLVEESGGVLGGYAMVVLGDPADPEVAGAVTGRPTAQLSKCYVVADHHGTGLAGSLITACLDVAGGRGAHSMWLGTHQDNTRAITFYTKHGFTVVGRRRFTIGGRQEDDVVMERLLPGSSPTPGEPPAVDHR
ncbi:N-acetyltransferase [Kocuria dechangensis]|uniref:N-acetyltransferase n=1 Tax=Kocuria dechangensis TaxID=1176249 RepID=A0A917H5J4_9MICC|nr:N-acetyltransferase [Kocuria dechangensis]